MAAASIVCSPAPGAAAGTVAETAVEMEPAAAPEGAAQAQAAGAGAAERLVRVVIVGCLSSEKVCELEVPSRSDIMDLKMALERKTGIAQGAQRLFCDGAQHSSHVELKELVGEASELEMRLVLVDPEWVKVCNGLEYGLLSLQDVSEDLRSDLDVVMAAVRGRGTALEHASDDLREQRQVVLTAVRQNGLALKFASEELQKDHEVVFSAVRRDGLALEFVSPALSHDREVVLAAVRQNGFALRFAPECMRSDHEIVLAAVKSDGRALTYASPCLKHDREIVVAACADNNECSADVPEELMKDPQVILALMQGIRIGGDMGGVVSWGIEMRKSYFCSMEATYEEDPDFNSDVEGDYAL